MPDLTPFDREKLQRAAQQVVADLDQCWAHMRDQWDNIVRLCHNWPKTEADCRLVFECVALVAGELARQRLADLVGVDE